MDALALSEEAFADLCAVRARLTQAADGCGLARRRLLGQAKDDFARLKRNVERLDAELTVRVGEGRQDEGD